LGECLHTSEYQDRYLEEVVKSGGNLVRPSESLFGLTGEEHSAHGNISKIIIEERLAGEVVVGDVGADYSSGYGEFEDFARLENEFRHHNGGEILLLFSEAMEL
jgi:hypothetical protein